MSYILNATERTTILDNMKKLLDEYDYDYTIDALNIIIDTWADRKESLITAFKKHPNYVENEFCIAFTQNYERIVDKKGSKHFSDWLLTKIDITEFFSKEIINQSQNGERIPWPIFNVLNNLDDYAERTLSEETTNTFSVAFPTLHFHKGEKTSRAVNRICEYLGVTKHPDYNREFAKYADSLSPMTIKRHTVLSINPLDYLTMSFGNSWASCHTIDKQNKRKMPNSYHGMYSSGTVSYMLDSPSMVFYTTDPSNEEKDFWNQPKINRQMFHWGEEKLIQGRLYPQDNDDNPEAYTPYRNIVQEIIAQIYDFPNLWKIQRGKEYTSKYIYSNGTNYRDYDNFDNCTLSRISGSENEQIITVGEPPICIHCGCEHEVEDNINCCADKYICAHCGCVVDYEDDGEWINGEFYCHDCCYWCEDCGEYYVCGDETYIEGYGNVCPGCLNDNYTYCDECEEYHPNGDMNYLERYEKDVCDDCLEEYYTRCEKCGEWILNGDMYDEHTCNDCHTAKEERK